MRSTAGTYPAPGRLGVVVPARDEAAGITATLDALRALVGECRAEVPPELPRALACLVGYFGYETIGLVETLAQPEADPLGLPDMIFVRPSVVLVFDRLADALFLVAPAWPDPAMDPATIVARAEERLDAVAAKLMTTPVPAPVRAARAPGRGTGSTCATCCCPR